MTSICSGEMNKNMVAVENFLRPAARCAILKMKKGKPETHGLPLKMKKLNALQHQPFTIGSSGRLFSVLKNLIEQTDKGNNISVFGGRRSKNYPKAQRLFAGNKTQRCQRLSFWQRDVKGNPEKIWNPFR